MNGMLPLEGHTTGYKKGFFLSQPYLGYFKRKRKDAGGKKRTKKQEHKVKRGEKKERDGFPTAKNNIRAKEPKTRVWGGYSTRTGV